MVLNIWKVQGKVKKEKENSNVKEEKESDKKGVPPSVLLSRTISHITL